jgi:glycerol transport system substrate-binding protein
VPDYPKLAQLWWQAIGDASSGAKTAQEAMDSLCAEQERCWSASSVPACRATSGRSSTRSIRSSTGSKLAKKEGNIAPQPKLANEKPQGETVDYDTLIKTWADAQSK